MVNFVLKRDGTKAVFESKKIQKAIQKAFIADGCAEDNARKKADAVTEKVCAFFSNAEDAVSVERIQDEVEQQLMQSGAFSTAKKYILYRATRTEVRESNTALMRKLNELNQTSSIESDLKRDNANIDGNSSMGTMLQMGAAASKEYYAKYMLSPEQKNAHQSGDIHIHDFDFYALTTTCCQIDLLSLFKGGFSTGHGYLREPQSIGSYAALAAIAIQSNQNDQHGGQSIPSLDYALAPGVAKTYKKEYYSALTEYVRYSCGLPDVKEKFEACLVAAENESGDPRYGDAEENFFDILLAKKSLEYMKVWPISAKIIPLARKVAKEKTEKATYQAMEGFIHNLNTMHSRAGAQTPFSSVNFGTDTSPEGRLVMISFLKATEAGLGNGETPIFPISILKVKEGINYNPEDPNYDIFKLACKVSAKRLFPNFSFIDAPHNIPYYVPGRPETEVATMGCRTRVMGNVLGRQYEIAYGRGNLSFTSINLPRIAIEANKSEAAFYAQLTKVLELVKQQLLDRFEIQARRKVYNYPFLMQQGVWIGAEKLAPNDEVREVLKHGTLSIGFIGLAETLVALYGKHHGEDPEMQRRGLAIVQFMRDFTDRAAAETHLNFSLLATPAEGLSGRFVRIDKERFGIIPGVTDKEYYTNSFHVPVYFPISAYKKIQLEAPYHALTNAGHISYVELDGDTANNVEAIESIVRCMHDAGIGYGSINHPVDRDPVCGYVGVIGDTCPRCGRKAGEAITAEELIEIRRKFGTR